jgi:C4-dicarboxylate-specific signal transduction histidine kinase
LTSDPLGCPHAPGSAATTENVATTGTCEVSEGLRPVGSASGADHLYEICHDMRQPVASIIALADAALSQAAVPSSVRCQLGQVRDQAEWLGELLQRLVEPPHPGMAESESCDLICLASDAVRIEAATYTGNLVLQWGEGDMWVLGNSVELRRAMANLLSNATRAAGPDGKVVVELCRAADRVLLTVDDSGPGFGLIRPGTGRGLHAVARGLKICGGALEYSHSPVGGVRAALALRAAGTPGAGCDDAPGHLRRSEDSR